ncbi:UDP-N-acetylmuramoyl-tripeptide--D-alanyl-D-alanine ligase [Shewanella surugensis]|uniref:UDP-N-acetylmuramoyl-tripeptide--D-alanyl-D-alanine ligase n=1 Tax=Shewanella surugensis TaxID=212020 RepID=A0ABT0L7C7_9GAMM|nr:UDP-N-acetylmuramoyl-tripeptide--D-alanyl-D-alanine ligase [Shewanella surugensis]MCL1123593.1 UDP-N-acetylmuramoyl-tripeptide--D-alanyl-D-alanine ligase [Shewanella surugensis]
MIVLTLSQICQHLREHSSCSSPYELESIQLQGEDIYIYQLTIDSRHIPKHGMFVALKGEHFDGHEFAQAAVDNGAIALLVEKRLPINVPQIVVPDPQRAMGEIGAFVRDFVDPVSVAITGSNGKTSVKEMVATILSQHYSVRYTAGNFNNEIGVPLTLLRLEMGDEYGVFELGANHKGEIDYTSALVKPSIAMVNNVASAHLEGFGSLEGVAAAKAEIFNHLDDDGVAIINADDDFSEVMRQASNKHQQLTFGVNCSADVMAKKLVSDPLGCYRFELHYDGQVCEVSMPLTGQHQVSNALGASAICLALGVSLNDIKAGLHLLSPVKGRMQPKILGRVRVIDDSYNANPSSVAVAINWLKEIGGNTCLILGDLAELGDNARALHAELGQLAKQSGIHNVFCVGDLTQETSREFGSQHCTDIHQLSNYLINYINKLPDEVTVLVKGSRSAQMERVVEALTVAYGRGEFV